MVTVLRNIALNIVDKNLKLTKVLVKKGIEFFSGNEDVSFIRHFPLILLPTKQSGIFKEDGGKWYPIWPLALAVAISFLYC